MELDKKAFLKKWKQDLEAGIIEYKRTLDSYNQERFELRIKKDILTQVVFKYSDSSALEDFKKTVHYADIVEDLQKMDLKYLELEEDLGRKIAYNNTIIRDIELSLL